MIRKLLSLAVVGSIAYACQNQPAETLEESGEEQISTEAEEVKKEEIRIYPKPEVAEFPEASLILEQPANEMTIEGSTVAFDFMVENYDLGAQTEEARMNLANSAKGQHIHLIIDNDPYSAHYDAGFSKEIEGGLHYAIAFLSRSYHESVKNPEAYEVFQFKVGMTDEDMMDLSQPALFYSRPKGTYSGEGTEKVLLDFYLHNTELSPSGNKVKVVVNDKDEFILDQWQPYILEGLPMGENTIYIELIDNNGAKVEVPINSITRTFILEE
jgi:hypothetical protein